MIVEERRDNMGMDGGSKDQFPVGMRVLAVDDDPTCLKLLETLLRRCQYQVTTTNQAITALKLLRENKDQFDLVISDVHMPDMDGFKLLELVGLEMDLPVIMLSANDDTKAVMRGITHGAVDYLLKPVRIEQLRNIWQHVIRRKKLDRRGHNNNDNEEDNEKPIHTNSKGSNESLDQCGKLNKKRKDQNEEDEDGCDDNTHDSDDPSSQKKPRVVWSVGLHCKFVAAVNQLGIDKAVPKRILDLMNVEKLTRENVASHLQKYRLYLKRLNAMATQQANMVAALGGRDLSNLPMGPFDGFGNFPALEAAGHTPSFSSYQSNSGVLNATRPTGLGLQGLARSGMVQFDRTPDINTTYPINDLHRNQHGTLLHGVPTISELDNFQQFKRIPEVSSGLSGESANSFVNVNDNSILLQAQKQFVQSAGFVPTVSSDPFEMGTGTSSYLPDLVRFNDSWQGVVPLSGYTAKTFPMDSAFTQNESAQRNTRAHVTPIISEMGIGGGSNILNFRSIGSSRHEEPIEGPTHEPSLVFGSSSSPPLFRHPINDPIGEGQRLNDGFYNKMVDRNIIGNTNFSSPFLAQGCKVVRSTTDAQAKADYISDISRIQGGLSSNGCGLNDLVNGMIKQEKDDFAFVDGDMGCDIFPLGACM